MEYSLTDKKPSWGSEVNGTESPKMSLIAMAAPHHPTTFRRDMMWEHGGRGIPELSVRPRQEQQDRVALPSIRQVLERGHCSTGD